MTITSDKTFSVQQQSYIVLVEQMYIGLTKENKWEWSKRKKGHLCIKSRIWVNNLNNLIVKKILHTGDIECKISPIFTIVIEFAMSMNKVLETSPPPPLGLVASYLKPGTSPTSGESHEDCSSCLVSSLGFTWAIQVANSLFISVTSPCVHGYGEFCDRHTMQFEQCHMPHCGHHHYRHWAERSSNTFRKQISWPIPKRTSTSEKGWANK